MLGKVAKQIVKIASSSRTKRMGAEMKFRMMMRVTMQKLRWEFGDNPASLHSPDLAILVG